MKKYGFLKHHRKIRIVGTSLADIVNKCIKNDIVLKDLTWENSLESTVRLDDEDYDKLKKAAGHSHRMTTIEEGGLKPLIRTMKHNTVSIIGAFFLGALIFYQSLFVAEIRVDGYKSIPETDIRQTLAAAGLEEGVRKPDDYDDIKTALYENHDDITWVSIFEEGRLIKVNVAEAGKVQEAAAEDETPVNIVASRSGLIEKITPLQGNAKVQKGDYVNKGDVLISGKYKYQSSDYSRGDDFYIMYSHAKGHAYAIVPRQIEFYLEKTERTIRPTGRMMPGIFLRIGDIEMDTADKLNMFHCSVRSEAMLIDTVRPLPIRLGIVLIREAELTENHRDKKETEKVVEAAIRSYGKDELDKGEEIVSYVTDYTESVNLIKASVFMEVLEDIGEEKKIKINKEEKTEKR